MLRIDLKNLDGKEAFALYDDFQVGEEIKMYKLESLGKYNGTACRYNKKQSVRQSIM